jgi:hypothetical protein
VLAEGLERSDHTRAQAATAFAPANQTARAFRPAGKLAIKVLTQYARLASTGWT